jgi:hypothetical protein
LRPTSHSFTVEVRRHRSRLAVDNARPFLRETSSDALRDISRDPDKANDEANGRVFEASPGTPDASLPVFSKTPHGWLRTLRSSRGAQTAPVCKSGLRNESMVPRVVSSTLEHQNRRAAMPMLARAVRTLRMSSRHKREQMTPRARLYPRRARSRPKSSETPKRRYQARGLGVAPTEPRIL